MDIDIDQNEIDRGKLISASLSKFNPLMPVVNISIEIKWHKFDLKTSL